MRPLTHFVMMIGIVMLGLVTFPGLELSALASPVVSHSDSISGPVNTRSEAVDVHSVPVIKTESLKAHGHNSGKDKIIDSAKDSRSTSAKVSPDILGRRWWLGNVCNIGGYNAPGGSVDFLTSNTNWWCNVPWPTIDSGICECITMSPDFLAEVVICNPSSNPVTVNPYDMVPLISAVRNNCKLAEDMTNGQQWGPTDEWVLQVLGADSQCGH